MGFDTDGIDIITNTGVEEGIILPAEVAVEEEETRSIRLIYLPSPPVHYWNHYF
jgi:hypothetical protein